MKKREIIKKIVSMLMIFALVVPIESQAYAADPTRGVEVNADLREKVDAFFTSIFFLCFFMSIIWLIPFFSTYDKRNSTS